MTLAFTPAAALADKENLCVPALQGDSAQYDPDYHPVAEDLFKQGHYRAAARAYYQMFLCPKSRLFTGLNPNVEDADLIKPFGAALSNAADGSFGAAVAGLKRITTELPRFGEARFLTGIFEWAHGDRAAARATWKATISAEYFTLPPDASGPEWHQSEAREMLKWSATQSK
jgi:hypothetical protein